MGDGRLEPPRLLYASTNDCITSPHTGVRHVLSSSATGLSFRSLSPEDPTFAGLAYYPEDGSSFIDAQTMLSPRGRVKAKVDMQLCGIGKKGLSPDGPFLSRFQDRRKRTNATD
jgi:hypothetical protein